jgi:hypothetical protein
MRDAYFDKEDIVIRLATFNLENLFTRPTAMAQATDVLGREAIVRSSTSSCPPASASF